MFEYCEPNQHGICKPMAVNKTVGLGGVPLVDIEQDENTNKLIMIIHFDEEEPLKVGINYCPMCGRKL